MNFAIDKSTVTISTESCYNFFKRWKIKITFNSHEYRDSNENNNKSNRRRNEK